MIFGDEPRFHKDIVHHSSGAIAGFKGSETDEHVGPGSYFAAQNEESRYLTIYVNNLHSHYNNK